MRIIIVIVNQLSCFTLLSAEILKRTFLRALQGSHSRRSQVVNLPVVFHQYQYIHAFVVCDLAGLLVPAWQGFFFSPDESQGGCQGPEFHIGERELQWRKRGLPSSCVMVWTVECVGVAASEKFAKKHSIGCTVGKTCTIPTMIWL